MLAHDHLDDLESFFYVYSYIIHVYNSSGAAFAVPQMFITWEQAAASDMAHSKYSFMRTKQVTEDVIQRWPRQCVELFEGFRKFLLPYVDKKRDMIEQDCKNNQGKVEKITDKVVPHYEMVLHLFDVAIKGLEEEEAEAAYSTVEHGGANSSFTSDPNYRPGRNTLKRELQDEDYLHGPLRVKRRHGDELFLPDSQERDFVPISPRSPQTPGTHRGESQVHDASPPPPSPESDC